MEGGDSSKSSQSKPDQESEHVQFVSLISGLGPMKGDKSGKGNPPDGTNAAWSEYDTELTLTAEIDKKDLESCLDLRKAIFGFQGRIFS